MLGGDWYRNVLKVNGELQSGLSRSRVKMCLLKLGTSPQWPKFGVLGVNSLADH